MINPAVIIKLPSNAAEINSALPCPYGCSLSFGFDATYKLYNPISPANTFTILSNASDKTESEWVMKYATNLSMNNTTLKMVK
jgi:hypothetical protein